MRVLWFSNCVLGNSISKGSGSWLFAMSKLICNSLELYNATNSPVDSITTKEYDTFKEILVPRYKTFNGIPEEKNIAAIQKMIEEIKPDIIHIWGLENIWGTLYTKGFIKGKVILEIQGLMQPCYDSFWGGLNPIKLFFTSLCVRNFIYPGSGLLSQKRSFKDASRQSENVLVHCAAVSTQSNWVRHQIGFVINEKCRVYKTLRPIRNEFWEATPWVSHNGGCKIFTSLSYYLPFKGVHILIKALSLLKQKYNNVTLEIAGVTEQDLIWYRQFGYLKYLKLLAKKRGVLDNIVFVGRLNAQQIIEHLLSCDVFVNPSFVESYSASTAEALALGVPTVTAYAGAMPDFSKNGSVALYYSPMDYTDCASKIQTLIENTEIRDDLRKNAKKEIMEMCGSDNVRSTQLAIYEDMIKTEFA